MRQHLGTRYDSKRGSFDWDLKMKLHEKGVFANVVDFPFFVDSVLLPAIVESGDNSLY